MTKRRRMTRVFGWIAGGFGIVYNLPQIYHLFKRKTAKDISRLSLVVRIIAYILYVIHGLLIADPPLFYMTLASLIQCFILAAQIVWYDVYLAHASVLPGLGVVPNH